MLMSNSHPISSSRVVTYRDVAIRVQDVTIHIWIDKFNTYGDHWREEKMKLINFALTKGEVIPENVAVWFANEVIEKRAEFVVMP